MATLHAHDLGLSWVCDDSMQRASHALVDDGRVWLVDPVDDAQALARVTELGEPAGVLQLLDRHNRDSAEIAKRLSVPHLRLPDSLPRTSFEPFRLMFNRAWKEVGLWWPARRALVVAEAVGTSPAFAVGPGPIGVQPVLRLLPPRTLRNYLPEHLLVGHGPPVHGAETAAQLNEALDRSRADLPRLVLALPRILRG